MITYNTGYWDHQWIEHYDWIEDYCDYNDYSNYSADSCYEAPPEIVKVSVAPSMVAGRPDVFISETNFMSKGYLTESLMGLLDSAAGLAAKASAEAQGADVRDVAPIANPDWNACNADFRFQRDNYVDLIITGSRYDDTVPLYIWCQQKGYFSNYFDPYKTLSEKYPDWPYYTKDDFYD